MLLILIYSGLPFLGIRLGPLAAVSIAFFLNNSAYYGEIFRAGLESVPNSQWEAARSTGLSATQSFLWVVLPQGIRNVLPDLVSNTVEVVKLTSLASVVSMPEMLYSADMARSLTFNASPIVLAAAIYIALFVACRAACQPARACRVPLTHYRRFPMRIITTAAAQMGPIQRADSREAVVKRMIALMDEAKAKGADLIVYPELALTTFFPRWYMEDQAEVDTWFEQTMPNAATQPLFERAAKYQMAMSFGYAERTPDEHHFNTCILTDKSAEIVGTYRKVHLPGHSEFDTERAFQHLEKRYFEPGDLGFNVWRALGGIFGMAICNDRRWPETYRVMGMQGVEMVLLGYNTPSVNSQKSEEGPEKRLFHNRLSVQAGAYPEFDLGGGRGQGRRQRTAIR